MNSVTIISVMSSFIILSNADQAAPATSVTRCYVCTSALHPGCADSIDGSNKFPHEGHLKKNYSIPCNDKDALPYYDERTEPVPVAVGCRKILQEVDDKTFVVRQCAYGKPGEGAEEVNGLKRTGNEGVRLFYYQCPRDNCNAAPPSTTFMLWSLLLPLALALVAWW